VGLVHEAVDRDPWRLLHEDRCAQRRMIYKDPFGFVPQAAAYMRRYAIR
jgi:hypothetical protein